MTQLYFMGVLATSPSELPGGGSGLGMDAMKLFKSQTQLRSLAPSSTTTQGRSEGKEMRGGGSDSRPKLDQQQHHHHSSERPHRHPDPTPARRSAWKSVDPSRVKDLPTAPLHHGSYPEQRKSQEKPTVGCSRGLDGVGVGCGCDSGNEQRVRQWLSRSCGPEVGKGTTGTVDETRKRDSSHIRVSGPDLAHKKDTPPREEGNKSRDAASCGRVSAVSRSKSTSKNPEGSKLNIQSASSWASYSIDGSSITTQGSLKKKRPQSHNLVSQSPKEVPEQNKRLPSLLLENNSKSSCNSRSSSRAPAPVPGTDDEKPYVIAHHDFLVTYLQELSTGVQWEIGRLLSRGIISYDNTTPEVLNRLRGTNAVAAPVVANFFSALKRRQRKAVEGEQGKEQIREVNEKEFPSRKEMPARAPWSALDEEEWHVKESEYNGLGVECANDIQQPVKGPHPTTNDTSRRKLYYGGRIHFTGSVLEVDSSMSDKPNVNSKNGFHVVLDRPELGFSSRFARRFGSSRFLTLSIPKSLQYIRDAKKRERLRTFLMSPMIVNGGVYRAFFSREGNVFLVRTDERYANEGIIPTHEKSQSPLRSLFAFMNWANPMDLNKDQSISKWVDRFALGLSNTVPAISLENSNIEIIDDKYALGYRHQKDVKPPSEVVTTDGCGFINMAALSRICLRNNIQTVPSALHVRVGGAKGLLLLHPEDVSDIPKVMIRKSQLKINFPVDTPLDPANLVIDLLRPSKLWTPSMISYEFIINLWANGVKTSDLIQLMKADMKDMADELMTWDGPYAMQRLFRNVCAHGGVITSRLTREACGRARMLGLQPLSRRGGSDRADMESLDIYGSEPLDERSAAWKKDQIDEVLTSLEEKVANMLSAGFTPHNSPYCVDLLYRMFRTGLKRFKDKYRIAVPCSARAFMVPDPIGILKPGEVFFNMSKPYIGRDGLEKHIHEGELLVGRNPCKLPSDIEKVVAVDYEKLRKYSDVVIFSVLDSQSPASRLSGGDYDGDEVTVIWQPEIVQNFRNAELCRLPEKLKDDFVWAKESVSDFLKRAPLSDSQRHVQELLPYLLNPVLRQAQISEYNDMHLNSAYMYGYGNRRTQRLGHMFCQCLDGPKIGIVGVKSNVLEADYKNFLYFQKANWRDDCTASYGVHNNYPKMPRDSSFGPFVMDEIKDAVENEEKIYMQKFEKHLYWRTNPNLYAPDQDLRCPWNEAERQCESSRDATGKAMLEDLNLIKGHVISVFEKFQKEVSKTKKLTEHDLGKNGSNIVWKDLRQMILREFVSGPSNLQFFDQNRLRELRASYAYIYSSSRMRCGWSRFPWDVAFDDLRDIKARGLGTNLGVGGHIRQHVAVKTDFYEFMVMHPFVNDTWTE